MNGGKILYAHVFQGLRFSYSSGIRLVDSINFLTMPLAKFTATFGLETKKGYYPHLFNTQANLEYVGEIPEEKYFIPDSMTEKGYQDFKKWYTEKQAEMERDGSVWDNKKELVEYCHADVQLLRKGCLRFRELTMQHAYGHDPFQENTQSSSALKIFQTYLMKPNQFAALPVSMVRELKPGFSGGRTGATKLYYKCSGDERIEYDDFTSLYPWVCKNGLYPVDHPVIYNALYMDPADLPDMEEGLSLWKVDVTCPQNLYHPLLHTKSEKLISI